MEGNKDQALLCRHMQAAEHDDRADGTAGASGVFVVGTRTELKHAFGRAERCWYSGLLGGSNGGREGAIKREHSEL